MKKLFIILISAIFTNVAFAQHRYHVENLTDYSKIQATSNGQHRVGTRESAPLACTGSPKIPVVLVQFSDLFFSSDTIYQKTTPHADAFVNAFFDNYCNGSVNPYEKYPETIGSVGPVRDYFIKQSDSIFQPQFKVIGPVTLSKSYKYYGEDASEYSKDTHISDFYKEAIQQSYKLGIDWSQFDNNGDGKIDFVFFIYAGEGQNTNVSPEEEEEHSYLIWPKESASDFTVYDSTYGNKTFGGYGCTNEIFNNLTDGIGTMCHELSHGLGLPDLYDYRLEEFGLDFYDVMDSGNYSLLGQCPVEYSSYEREFMGWLKNETIDITKSQTITIQPIERSGKGYKIFNPNNSNEYYLLENRQSIDFDTYFGYQQAKYKDRYGENKGIIIYHINYNKSIWTSNRVNSQSTQYFTILPADGELISSSDADIPMRTYLTSMIGDLYPGSLNVTSIDSTRFTTWTKNNIPVNITRIQQNEDLSITIDINGGDPTAINDIVDENVINENDSAIYDLSGRRIVKPEHGFYIKNGKKYFIK